MRAKQRHKNRSTEAVLAADIRKQRNMKHICENCGEPGGHWVAMPASLEDILSGYPSQGFYTCKKEQSCRNSQ